MSFSTQNDHLKAIRVVAIISSDFFLLGLDQIMINIEILKKLAVILKQTVAILSYLFSGLHIKDRWAVCLLDIKNDMEKLYI